PRSGKELRFPAGGDSALSRAARVTQARMIETDSRAGTSLGADVAEALSGQSRRDLHAIMANASKEAREACYWLRLVRDSELSYRAARAGSSAALRGAHPTAYCDRQIVSAV
ncbi:MAG: four helix bundle protein, partial [Gemmatimonadetes bacterium]|nr:four helix bundle protein [Gemmatimonadota bacterium]